MKRSQHHRSDSLPKRPRKLSRVAAAAVAVAALAIVGCGGSSSSSSAPKPAVYGGAAAEGAVPAAGATAQSATSGATAQQNGTTKVIRPKGTVHAVNQPNANHTPPPKIIVGNPVRRPARGTGGSTYNDEHRSGKVSATPGFGPSNPCALVTRAQAQAFTHRPVAAPKLAPLGPTCVYHELGAHVQVTLAVEAAVFSTLKPHIQHLSRFTVGGRTAYCGVYGSPVTYVVLSANRLLSILAPCDVGSRFAGAAVPKLG